ncbi:ribosome hibernation promotion factor [Actinomadura bangladeshensis]|uniref:HPF/RaiA family ribosome-associated protein n=1 Tax=Actinomadura bangladeshensis TaxID=453573 RepID=A0A6L9QUQ2_9ACTN|nr:sigma 54 modulation/S30EA ribosomal C-terminal domain-containing protein [Actinomadura bangladeshensis]NEA29141.1 HPF/RaiA family ribosome-associated protein [Actinomadura bangladeshensis]
MVNVRNPQAPDVVFDVRGDVPDRFAETARDKVAAAFRQAPEPVLFARVKLATAPDPAVERPATAQATVDVNGRPVRVHAAAATMQEAIDLLPDLLRARFERIGGRREASRAPKAGRHAHRPARRDLPPGEREIVRRKTFAPDTQTPDEAAFDMDVMDYDFWLFTDAGTGQDAVLYRADGGYRIALADPEARRDGPVAVPLTVSPHPAPRIGEQEAVERLEALGLPFLFFADADTGRGKILYHRYDGHYGLLESTP